MKIYTKTGDKGNTSLFGGVKVAKSNIRIDAYGTIDELNSSLGLLRSFPIDEKAKEQIIEIQKELFHLGAELATPEEKMYLANGKMRLPKVIESKYILKLENWIDEMDKNLSPLTHFIIPGGDLAASYAHLSRCICRRSERLVVALSEVENIREELLMYLNRLSDYLFVLARKIANDSGHQEIKWLPNE